MKAKLLARLIEMRDKPETIKDYMGICSNGLKGIQSESLRYDLNQVMMDIFPKWEKYSGNEYTPIGSGVYGTDPLWDRSTQYGQDHWELLNFMISELSK